MKGISSGTKIFSSIATSHSFDSWLMKSLAVIRVYATGILGFAGLIGVVGIQGSSQTFTS